MNCAGGMNNKAIVDDWRIKLLLPLLWFIDFLLKQRPIASAIFERVKQRYFLFSLFSPLFIILKIYEVYTLVLQGNIEEYFTVDLCK